MASILHPRGDPASQGWVCHLHESSHPRRSLRLRPQEVKRQAQVVGHVDVAVADGVGDDRLCLRLLGAVHTHSIANACWGGW